MVKIHLPRLLGEERQGQAELARITGIGALAINSIYNEFSERINPEHLSRICRVLDCNISDILEYMPDEPR